MRHLTPFLIALLLSTSLPAEPSDTLDENPVFVISGTLENRLIDEASGLQAGENDVFYVHNDEKRDVFVIDATGRDLGSFKLDNAKNKDWEDITRIPSDDGPVLVLADTGDNGSSRKHVSLYFFREPAAGEYSSEQQAFHRLKIRYPDGPRDVESVAYDPHGRQILLLSKRNKPPRLYGIPLESALSEKELEAELLAEVPSFRPPTRDDLLSNPKRGWFVSQPTGMDISPDGRRAAVISYRSLYVFERAEGQSWAEALQEQPLEYVGPPGLHDEAVSFSHDGTSIYITTERRPAPIYRLDLE